MEICRKIPTSECNFNDWIKDAAGTTALPSRGGTLATPASAPRYIDPQDERFPRRLAFLRYDDIYKDGNETLVLVTGSCPSRDNVWPMPIGVTNGNNSVTAASSPGFTYPQAMGSRNTPFTGDTLNGRNNAYGNVPCPPVPKPLIRITDTSNNNNDVTVTEGRRMYLFPQTTFTATTANPTNPPLRAGDVPIKPAADPSIEIISNTNAPIAAGGNLLPPSFATTIPDPLPPSFVWQNHANRNITNNNSAATTATAAATGLNLDTNAVYRRINFRVRVDNPSGVKNLATIATNPITVEIGTLEPPSPFTTSLPGGASHVAKGGLAGSQPQVKNTRGATLPVPGPPLVTGLGFDTIGTEEPLSAVRGPSASGGVDYISTVYMNVNTTANPNSWMPADTVGATQVLRFPDTRNPNCSTIDITTTSCFQDVTILVVRDSADEEEERFRLRIANPNTGVTDAALSQGPTATSNNGSFADYRWGIIANDDAPPGGAGTTGVTGGPTTTTTTTTGTTPTTTTTTTGTTTGPIETLFPPRIFFDRNMRFRSPFSALLPPRMSLSNPLGAAYPATKFSETNYPFPGATKKNFRFNPPSLGGSLNTAWGEEDVNNNGTLETSEDLNGNGIRDDKTFPDVPPDAAPATNGAPTSGETPMLPSISNARPASVARALWYRTTNGDGDPTGSSDTARHRDDRGLFIYNTSYNSSLGINGTFNVNQPAPLVLPETVCIDTTDGAIDSTCTRGTATTLNLNLPLNPIFPSGTNRPASSFTVCGLTGNSRRYQAVEKDIPTLDITGSTCPTTAGNNTRSAITDFYTGLVSAALDPSNVAAFQGAAPTRTNPTKPTGATYNRIRLTASNAIADANKINVFNLVITGTDINGNGNATEPNELANVELTLAASQNNPDPTFLLRAPSTNITLEGLYVKLDGVDPNKVFWVFPQGGKKALTIQGSAAGQPTVLVGNFIGNMPATGGTADTVTGLNIGPTSGSKGVAIRSARFLGFRAVTAATAATVAENTPAGSAGIGVDSTAMITAMTTVNEPMVVPVLQIHSPIATATNGNTNLLQPTTSNPVTNQQFTNGINGNVVPTATPTDGTGQWTQRASKSTINVYFVAGNTPSRSYVPYGTVYTGESSGGLNNFVRFMENWISTPLEISGGFIQNTRSAFATATYSPNFPYANLTAIDSSSGIQTWFTNPAAPTNSLSNFFKYYQSITGQAIPYFSPPRRLWGFDVGLLVQQPDLFAQRFSQPRPDSNEFFREATKDDPWVKTLLCALQPVPTSLNTPNSATSTVNPNVIQRLGTVPPNYTFYALGSRDRPTDCVTPTYNNAP